MTDTTKTAVAVMACVIVTLSLSGFVVWAKIQGELNQRANHRAEFEKEAVTVGAGKWEVDQKTGAVRFVWNTKAESE